MAEADDTLAKEILERIQRAELDRTRHEKRMLDCYRFTLPWRHRFRGGKVEPDAADDIFDSTAMTAVGDFAGDMLSTFTPPFVEWLSVRPAEKLEKVDQKQLQEALEQYRKTVFAEMRRSNLYEALQESYRDLPVGTMAVMIQDRDVSEPIHCQAVPITDLLIDRGPWGEVDGRWRRMMVRGRDIRTLWPKAKLDGIVNADTAAEVEVTDGLYRDRTRRGVELYRYVVMVASKIVFRQEYRGAGSCPLVVARWATDSDTAWGFGPLYSTLAEVKGLNYIVERGLKNLDKAVDPVTAYDDDGVINPSHGIEAGTWMPKASGSKIEVIEPKARFDVQWMHIEDMRAAIKRALFQDGPEQPGKTPPTATQWLDEAMKLSRRMGSPSGKLVTELQYPIFQRFAYLLARRGVLPPVRLNGRDIALQPESPLLRAQQQEELVRIDRFLELAITRFGQEQVVLWIKTEDTLKKMAELLGVPARLIRSPAEVQQVMQQMAAAAAAQQQGAPAA